MEPLKDILSRSLGGVGHIVRSWYHFALAWFGDFAYEHPSASIIVIAVTGTKGKSSVVEMINSILEAAGHTTAVSNSIRFKIGNESKPNLTRMSMPGRLRLQKFLSQAITAGCTAAVIEMTSEGARQFRHRFIELDALVFTNLAPEHIESHGSFQAYADSKYEIGKQLARSHKRPRIMVANSDDPQSNRYLTLPVEMVLPFSLEKSVPYQSDSRSGYFTFENTRIDVPQPGDFSIKNALAAATLTRALGVDVPTIIRGLATLNTIPGRAERIEAGQDFTVVVDYAHTPDSLEALYAAYGSMRKICVLGSCGGGRDTWKRPIMGRIAAEQCETVILTNEDPYEENPQTIIDDLAHGMGGKKAEVVMDRRLAIRHALELAHSSDAVLITGKGTDPSIAEAHGKKTPWSDAAVAREEIEALLTRRKAV